MKDIYLDNSTTTRPSPAAVSGMLPFFTDMWGVPSAPHGMGQRLLPTLKESYREIYALLGASESDPFVFTSSGAEAVNQAFISAYFEITAATGKNHYIVSSGDEAPALMGLNRLEEMGCVGTTLPLNQQGLVTPEVLGDAITPRTAMVSLSWGNGLTGVIQPVKEIAALCKNRGILFHLDATHVLGKLYFELDDVGADLISFNGDHLHAPKGTGGLWIRSGVQFTSLIVGGMEQGGWRAGPVNMPALAALGIAAKEAVECRDLLCMEVARLRNMLEEEVLAQCPGAVVFFRERERLPHCSTIGFPGAANEALLFLLNRKKVFASIGGGSFQQLGLLLAAAGVPDPLAHSAISFSLSRETTEDEIRRAVEIIAGALKSLRKTSMHIEIGGNDGV